MKNSLKEKLKSLIIIRKEVGFGDLVTFAMEEGYKPDNMTRRMRELCAEGGIVPIMGVSRRGNDYIKSYKAGKLPEKPRIVIENGKAIMYI